MALPYVDPTAPPSLLKRIITPVALTKAGTWFLKNVSRRIDPTLVKLSRGRVSTIGFTPVVLLTTTGARSGLARTTPMLYFTDRDRIVLMASNYGGAKHPAWYHNRRSRSAGPRCVFVPEAGPRERWSLTTRGRLVTSR